jgi:alkaline phosphatase
MIMPRRVLFILILTALAIQSGCHFYADQSIEPDGKSINEKHLPNQPKNIILMIGDGMGVTQVYAALTARKGQLEMARCSHTGFSITHSADDYVTDSAAGGTAIATGEKTNNGYLSITPEGDTLKTILQFAEFYGLGTGLVATCKITHATPASFISHQISRGSYEEIALDFLKTDVDVFIGGGRDQFEKRKDGLNLSDLLRSKNYQVVYDLKGLAEISQGKVAGLIYDDHPPKYSEGRGDFLAIASKKAIELLASSEKGFFLMIEGSQIDWAGHDKDPDYLLNEMVDFDNVVGCVLDYAEQNGETLVIITSDHETGGYVIKQGNMVEGTVDGSFMQDDHTGVMVPVFAYGPGADRFTGIMENTSLFDKMMNLFGFEYEIFGKHKQEVADAIEKRVKETI